MKILKYIFLLSTLFLFSRIFAQPSPPQNLEAHSFVDVIEGVEITAVQLRWDKVKKANGDYVPLYEIFRKDGGINSGNEFESLGEIIHRNGKLDFNVENGKTYTYYVIAKEQVNMEKVSSDPSDMVEITVGNDPIGLEKGTISGKVTDEDSGLPLEGIYVSLFSTNSFDVKVVMTDAEGNYSSDVYPGNYFVYFRALQDYYPEFYNNVRHVWEATDIDVQANETFDGIDASLTSMGGTEQFTISGNVSDSESNPLDARIDVIVANKKGFYDRHRHVRTDQDGNYSISVREGSKVVLYAKAKSHAYYGEFYNDSYSIANAERITVNENITGIDFVLEMKPEANASISGLVENAEGTPLDAMVMAIKLGTPRMHRLSNLRTFTDEEGNYTLQHLLPGDYVLFAVPEEGYMPTFYKTDGSITNNWREADILTIEENDNLTDISFYPDQIPASPENGFAELGGIVRDANGNPVVEALVSIFNDQNEFVKYTFTDLEGKFYVIGLIPGVYKVECGNYSLSSEVNSNVTVGIDAAAVTNFDLSEDPYIVTGVEAIEIPTEYNLGQNYPNPFNPTTVINFAIADLTNVELKVYDILGAEIVTLVNEELSSGNYKIQFDANNLPSGLYIYQIKTNNFIQSKKMLLLK